jgi:hypothetical protein
VNSKKVILDLCGGTGAWSKPYREAGYDVRVITLTGSPLFGDSTDVRDYVPPADVYGILAAPPCTQFSFARTKAIKERDFALGMAVVHACLKIIWECQYRTKGKCPKKPYLRFWAIENPYGMLNWFLGEPALIFNPYDYGDRYQKRTCLWGCFGVPRKSPIELNEDEKQKFGVHSQKLKPLPKDYHCPDDWDKRAARRSITPPGFAKAFFEANK